MKRIKQSFGHALQGFTHALQTERNLRLFLPVYGFVLILGVAIRLLSWEWLALIFAGGTFLSVELLNTAIERLTDVLDDQKKIVGKTHYHAMLKAAKDVGAAASLVSLGVMIIVTLIVFGPYVSMMVR